MKKKAKKRGFTLIEIIIAMTIMVIVGGVIVTITVSNSKILSKVDMRSELQMEAQIIQNQLTNVALDADGVVDVEFEENSDTIKYLIIQNENNLHVYAFSDTTLTYYLYEMIKVETDDEADEKYEYHYLQEKELSSKVLNVQVLPSTKEELLNSKHIEFKVSLTKTSGVETVDYEIDNYIVFRNFKR
ncbi:MAG: type II secretion system GspH family protein [Turicibacter sp.]|nr:type II secretion system GspH family protein [Turicibacter sp.]